MSREPMIHASWLEHIQKLPFIRDVSLRRGAISDPDEDAEVILHTPDGEFHLPVEIRRSYLTRMTIAALIARWSQRSAHSRTNQCRPLLLARSISQPTADRLTANDINFVDRAGNLRIALNDRYYALIIGQPDTSRDIPARASSGAGFTKVLFTFLLHPDSVQLPVRGLALAANVGKTVADGARKRMLRDRILDHDHRKDGKRSIRILHRQELASLALRNYGLDLRPRLLLGRYRPQERYLEAFQAALGQYLHRHHPGDWGLTGSSAAWILQRYYRGEGITAFIPEVTPEMQRMLHLIPDPEGPVTFLQHYAPNITEERISGVRTAHPWLIYAELLYEGTPRALESADRIRQEYLT